MNQSNKHPYKLNSEISKTDAVVQWVCERIERQIYKPYQLVPSIRQLTTMLNASSYTISQAYEELVATNILMSKPGAGYYVLPPKNQLRNQDILDNTIEDTLQIDTRWLVQQMFSGIPIERAPGSGELLINWIKNERMQWAVRQVNNNIESFIYNYGDIQGYEALREKLVEELNVLGINTTIDNVVTTTGVSQAILLVVQLLIDKGECVIVDSPGWYWTTSTLQQQGYKVVAVERDHEGPNIEQLEKVLQTHRPKLYITNSILHNPTSFNLSASRAHQVLNLMHKYNAYIFEDDLYAVFLSDNRVLRYANIDQFDRVFYATGFSKSMASGWRVGMLVSPDDFINQVLRFKTLSNMTSPEFGERVVYKLWTQGVYRRQLRKVHQNLYLAHQRLRVELAKIGLNYSEHTQPGLFVWVDCKVDTAKLALKAFEEGWLVAPGQLFHPDHQPSTYMRLNVVTTSDEFLHWLEEYLVNCD